MSIRLNLAVSVLMLASAHVALAQASPGKPERIRGEIVSLQGATLQVHRKSGNNVTIQLQDKSALYAVKALQLSDIKAGTYVGAAAMPTPDGKLVAKEVLVFPEAARGMGEGHYSWDTGANSSMTNANVDTVVQGTSGRDLKLSYKGGSNTVTVPPGAPVVTIIPAQRSEMTAGKKVFIVAMPGAGGTYSALQVVVEKDGVVPPM